MSAKPPPHGNSPSPSSNAPPPAPTLTATAPVSSLLPQIPSQPAAVLALLTAQMQQQQQAAAAAQSQLLAARAAPAFLSNPANVQDMSLEQLGKLGFLCQRL